MKLHLPKGLFVAVMAAMAAMMPASYAAGTEVWVNFGGTNYGVTEAGKTWNNILGNNAAELSGTYTLLDKNGAAAGTLTLTANHNPYDSRGAASLDILKGYLDYNAENSATYWTVNLTLDDIAATGITVNAYNSGDGNNKIAPLTVNGKNYVGDASEAGTNYINHESSTSWGDSKAGAQETELNGKNTVTVTNLSGIVTMTPMTTTNNTQGRFTLAGLSIEWDGSTSATGVELDTGVNNADYYLQGVETANRIYSLSGNADNTSTFHIAAGETVQGLQSAANTVTITSDGAIGVNQLWAKAGTTLNLGATLNSGSDLSIGGCGTINFAANQTIGKLTSTAAAVSVAEGAQLTIGSMESATEAGKFITNVTGKGSIEFKSDVYIVGGQSLNASWQPKSDATCTTVQFAGDLKISNKATLTVGHLGGGHHYGYWTDLSNLKSVQLTDATIYFHSRADKLKSLIVNAGSDESDYTSTLKLFQVTGVEQTPEAITIQSLTLNDDLLVKSTYTSQVVVESMTGAGNLNIHGTESGGTLAVSLTTGADYSGIISVGNSRSDSTTVTVNIADGTTLNDTQLVKTGTDNKASISLKGAGNYNITSPTSAITNGLTNDKSWTGTVKMTGQKVNNQIIENHELNLNKYGNTNSKVQLSGMAGSMAEQTVNTQVIFDGSNGAAFDWKGNGTAKLTFANTVSGSGNIAFGAGGQHSITFTGDVSGWDGVIWGSRSEGMSIAYSGQAKEINHQVRSGVAGSAGVTNVTYQNKSGMVVNGAINTDTDGGQNTWARGVVNLKVLNEENATGEVVFNGAISNNSNSGATNLTVGENASAKFTNANVKLTDVTMDKGASLAITAAKTLTFQNLTLADGTTINPKAAATLVDAAEATTNVSITVSKKASFGADATINADLTLANGATVEMAKELTLGGTLTLSTGLTLGGDLLTTIVGFAGQTDTQKQILFTVAGLNLVGADALTTAAEVGISETKVAFSDYFTNNVTTETGAYYLGYDGSNVYVEFVAKADEPEEDPSTPEGGGNVPEPTTGALSLIGLAALAMRRRRK